MSDKEKRLPMDSLICAPIIAAARGQQELTKVYIENLKRLAYSNNEDETNTPDLKYKRPVMKPDGSVGETEEMAKLASLMAQATEPIKTRETY